LRRKRAEGFDGKLISLLVMTKFLLPQLTAFFLAQSYLSSSSKPNTPISSRLKTLYSWLAWVHDEDLDSAVTLWFECFMAAGLSPAKSSRNGKENS
jgi:hypothetical protein